MAKYNRIPSPIERFPYRNPSIVGMRADLDTLPSVELLDQYAVLLALPVEYREASALRLTLIRDILLTRLAGAA